MYESSPARSGSGLSVAISAQVARVAAAMTLMKSKNTHVREVICLSPSIGVTFPRSGDNCLRYHTSHVFRYYAAPVAPRAPRSPRRALCRPATSLTPRLSGCPMALFCAPVDPLNQVHGSVQIYDCPDTAAIDVFLIQLSYSAAKARKLPKLVAQYRADQDLLLERRLWLQMSGAR